jgi:nitrogen regulatory protein PII-like uncharacterized protein
MFGCKRNFEKFLNLLKDEKIENFTTTRFIQGKTNRWAVAWSFCEDLKDFKDYLHKNPEKSITVLKHVIEGEEIEKIVERVEEILNSLKIEIINEDKIYNYELKAVENTWSNQRRKRRAEQRNEDILTSSSSQQQELIFGLEISKMSNSKIIIQTHFISGTMSKDCVNQILQYIKNKLK